MMTTMMNNPNDGHVNKVKLNNGKIVEFKTQSESEERGRKYLSHIKNLIYLGEGVHYSHNGVEVNSTKKAHFFTWD